MRAAPLVLALVAGLVACTGSASESDDLANRGGAESPTGTGGSENEPANQLIGDASAASGDQYRGSPLCRILSSAPPDDATTCDPDDVTACGFAPAPDSGMASSASGCRLEGPNATPACGGADPAKTDGAKCQTGSDCAPGFDCVTTKDGGSCRRYCCSGSCGTHRSQNGAETFCDVQKLVGGDTKAPVCMPIKSCVLFVEGECAESETCSVVTDDGTTGCVANGSAKAGDSCDDEHCSAGLTCLGQAGSRKCFELCRTTKEGPSCGSNESCKTSTIFSDPTVGVCAPSN